MGRQASTTVVVRHCLGRCTRRSKASTIEYQAPLCTSGKLTLTLCNLEGHEDLQPLPREYRRATTYHVPSTEGQDTMRTGVP